MPASSGAARRSQGSPAAAAAAAAPAATVRPSRSRAIRKAPRGGGGGGGGDSSGLSALLGGLSIDRSAFWTPTLIEYFERVSAIKADVEAIFADIGALAVQQARVVAGDTDPTLAMESAGRMDAAVARTLGSVESARSQLAASTAARLAELGGDASCVEMRIRHNIDGSLERKLGLCLDTLQEARVQFAAEMTKEGWRPPAEDASSVWTFEPAT